MKRFPDTEDIRATLQLLSLEGEDFDPSSFENAILLGGKYAVNRILACEGQGTIVVATEAQTLGSTS